MIKSVNNYPVSQLFDGDSSVVYFVPRYQREYTWGKAQWDALFDDIQENDVGYFLGSIICINQSEDALDVQRLEVVDGQQRLTTLSLLFAAIYSALSDLKEDLDDEERNELFNLKRKIVLKKGTHLRVTPQAQNNNLSDYQYVMTRLGLFDSDDQPANAGNRKIVKGFRYFLSRLDEMLEASSSRAADLLGYLGKVTQANLVKIEVDSHADAYTLFESLNNRGTPLTAIDLIKNKLLAKLEATEPGKIDDYFRAWKRLLDWLGDDYAVQERFFRQYYNAFKSQLNDPFRTTEDKKKDPLGVLATRSNLIPIYERLINHDAKNHLADLTQAGRLYALMLSRNDDEQWKCLNKPLLDLERIQGAPSYLLLLYLLVHQKKLALELSHLEDISRFLVRFFVRRNLTELPPTYDLSRIFMNQIEGLSGKNGDDIVFFVKQSLRELSASDEIFMRNLQGAIYEENFGVTRFVLTALAEKEMTRESWVDLWRIENKHSVWTIEHIFPQGENIPQAWVDMIAKGDYQLAKSIQKTLVHTLGNLTISGYNSALGNKSFIEKRDRTDTKGRFVGYKNGLKLNDDLADASEWTKDKIEARTLKLAAVTAEIFSIGATP